MEDAVHSVLACVGSTATQLSIYSKAKILEEYDLISNSEEMEVELIAAKYDKDLISNFEEMELRAATLLLCFFSSLNK